MKKSVSDLSNIELDYMVARATHVLYMRDTEGRVLEIDKDRRVYTRTADARMFAYTPTTDWRQGGPLIDKFGISVQRTGAEWTADIDRQVAAAGPTPLVAAMRALVTLKLGAMVEID
ncbi:MAG: DUF2591 family protein [Betaproteobacteria bacterium]|nr:DUF2591 family protein [Betaproteobacteria bacterium]